MRSASQRRVSAFDGSILLAAELVFRDRAAERSIARIFERACRGAASFRTFLRKFIRKYHARGQRLANYRVTTRIRVRRERTVRQLSVNSEAKLNDQEFHR